MQITIVLYDGFDNLDAVGPFEVFGHARDHGADIAVTLRTHREQVVVTSSHGLRVQPDGVLSDPAVTPREMLPDLVVVPGGGWTGGNEPSARTVAEQGDLPALLERLHQRGVTLASVCTGAMILAAAGLTDDRPAVTHHSALGDLESSGADVVEKRVVDDGDLVTAGGVTAGLDLALHLVERATGPEMAQQVADTMAYKRQGTVSTPADRRD